MLVMMMMSTNKPRRPQEQRPTSAAAQVSAGGVAAMSAPVSSSADQSAAPSTNLAAALGQLGKSSNSSNETVIALEQTTESEPRSGPLSAPPPPTSQISSSASTSLAEGEQLAEEKKPRLSKTPSNILKDDAPQMMIHNQDRRNAANVMTTLQTGQKVAEPQTDRRSDQDISSGEIRDNREQQRREQSIGRLRAFLLLTRSHLNPFHHDRQKQQQPHHKCNQTNIKHHQVKRKQSLDSSSCASAASSAASLVVANHPNHNSEAAAELATANSNSKLRAGAAETRTERRADDDYSHRNEKKFVNLFNLAQRCFFFKQSSGEFSLNHHGANLEPAHNTSELAAKRNTKCKSSVSAPVTPIKWNPLNASTTSTSTAAASAAAAADDCDEPDATSKVDKQSEQIPNGLGSAPGGCLNTGKQQTNLTAKPSVRFVESCRNGGGAATDKGRGREKSAGKWRAVHTQTSSPAAAAAADQAEQQKQQPRQDCDDSSVANLFKLQDVVEEGESPMNSTSFRQHGYSLIDYISNYLDTIKERRVTPLNIEPGYLKDLIEPDAPERGESFANIMHDFENHIMCGITHWQHPHFHAYFPAGNAYPSILADMLSDALGCVGFSWAASPAYTELEIIMLDWMGKMIGLPDEFLCLSSSSSRAGGGGGGGGGGSPATEEAASAGKPRESKGGGVIQGSASECVLVNLLAARHWAMEKLRKKHPHTHDGILLTKLIGYCSKEAHSCVEKAAMIGFIRMRALDTDEQHSLRGETLAKAIAMDKANGLEPFLVCATLGTTSCVSFDNLAELGPVCRDEDIWLHVDAAYAGSALICPEFQYLMKGIELVTSFNMNPNKWMLINFDCSLMWVKDRFKLTRAFVVDPLYLQHSFSDQAIDYRHWGIPLSRRFRALKLWFVIRNYGVAGLQAYIRNHVRLAKLFEQLIRQDSRFTINNQVVLGLVCFRLIGSNALNQRLLSMINASGKLHMVPASLEGRYVIRFCVCDQNAREEDIRFAYECIAQFATELFESIRAGRERIRAISQQNTIDVSSVSLHTQQSASADRLNRLATAGQPAAAAVAPTGTPERDTPDDHAHQADDSTPARAASSANREAARQYMMASRRSSHAVGETEQQQLPPGGAKSPLKKQASMQLAPVASCGEMEAAAAAADQDDLEQEIVLDSLASIDGFDYDLEDDFEDGDEGDALDEAAAGAGQVNEAPEERAVNQESAQAAASVEPGATAASRTPHLRRRLRSSHTTAASAFGGGGGAGERDEAEDEVFHLAKERRNRMSLRYKREFFVRVVSDPRVYRASISGDINASSNSLANQQQQSATTTSVPRPLAPPPAKAAD